MVYRGIVSRHCVTSCGYENTLTTGTRDEGREGIVPKRGEQRACVPPPLAANSRRTRGEREFTKKRAAIAARALIDSSAHPPAPPHAANRLGDSHPIRIASQARILCAAHMNIDHELSRKLKQIKLTHGNY
jgi:hypothetical protein